MALIDKPTKLNWAHALLSFFPPTVVLAVCAELYMWIREPRWLWPLSILATLYVLPLLCFRVCNLFFQLREGYTYFDTGEFIPWFAAIKFQLIYIAFPALEQPLLFTPGLYSVWLRLWGSKIGRGVIWTPRMDVADRTGLIVGDSVLFGHGTYLSCHYISVKDQRPFLYYKKIKFGDQILIGMHCRIGPGVEIEGDQIIPAGTDLYPNARRRTPDHETLRDFN